MVEIDCFVLTADFRIDLLRPCVGGRITATGSIIIYDKIFWPNLAFTMRMVIVGNREDEALVAYALDVREPYANLCYRG